MTLQSASHKETLQRQDRFREVTALGSEATGAILPSRGPARLRRKPTRRGSRRNQILRAPLKTLLGLRQELDQPLTCATARGSKWPLCSAPCTWESPDQKRESCLIQHRTLLKVTGLKYTKNLCPPPQICLFL